MYVCVCNAITDRAIRAAAETGVATLDELTMSTGCSGGCGCCRELAMQVLAEARAAASGNNRLNVAA